MSISQHPVHSPSSWPERCLAVVGSLMFAITFLAILTGVFSRYFNLHGFEWSFEIATIGFVWVTFIGTVIAEIRHENVRFHGLVKLLPAPCKRRSMLSPVWPCWASASGYSAAAAHSLHARAGCRPRCCAGPPDWAHWR